MRFLAKVLDRSSRPKEIDKTFAEYRGYIESVRSKLPVSAYKFAVADWHYDATDHRCLHDSWVESLQIREPSTGNRHHVRETEITVRLLGAYHDGSLELSYSGVCSYSLSGKIPAQPKTGHGDWLTDEIRLSDEDFVLHEIVFSSGSHWLIECLDIAVRWLPHS
jgi:hypothetical protein